MMKCDILLILQYRVSATVTDLVVVFALFVFVLVLLCFCVATIFSVNKDLYIIFFIHRENGSITKIIHNIRVAR